MHMLVHCMSWKTDTDYLLKKPWRTMVPLQLTCARNHQNWIRTNYSNPFKTGEQQYLVFFKKKKDEQEEHYSMKHDHQKQKEKEHQYPLYVNLYHSRLLFSLYHIIRTYGAIVQIGSDVIRGSQIGMPVRFRKHWRGSKENQGLFNSP